MNPMSQRILLTIRIVTFLVAFLTVAWQILQAATGNWDNAFFFPDLVVGIPLTVVTFYPANFFIELSWLIGLSSMAGVYLVSCVGALTVGEYTDSFGPLTTTVGLVACIPCMLILSQRLMFRHDQNRESGVGVQLSKQADGSEETA